MMLDQRLHTAIREGCFQPSRVRPLRSHLKRYAAWLGVNPASCPAALYHLAKDRRDELITNGPGKFSPAYRKNIRNDVDDLLEMAVKRGWLPPLTAPLKDWRTKGDGRTFEKTYYHRMGDADRSPYALGKRDLVQRKRGEPRPEQPPPGLKELAPRLHTELDAYLSSCRDEFDPETHWRIKKRPITCHQIQSTISRLAGYAVYMKGWPAETLNLRQLGDPAFLTDFAFWWLRRRKKNTAGVRTFLHTMSTISTHVLRDDTLVKAIHGLFDRLGHEEAMIDDEPPWLDLEELDLIGQSRHPLNERRLQDSPYAQEVAFYVAHPHARPRGHTGSTPRARVSKTWPSGLNIR